MKESVSVFIQYGALGTFVVGMGWYIIYLHKERRKERKESNEIIQKQFETQNELTKETSSILAGLKTLLEVDIQIRKK